VQKVPTVQEVPTVQVPTVQEVPMVQVPTVPIGAAGARA
jgi:hypothetical protein